MTAFNSVTLPLSHVEDEGLPSRDKVVEFPGNDGCEVLPMGKGPRTITVSCVASGGSPSRTTLEGLMDDELHTLDADSQSYGNCRCVAVSLVSKAFDASTGGYREYYRLTFRQERPD